MIKIGMLPKENIIGSNQNYLKVSDTFLKIYFTPKMPKVDEAKDVGNVAIGRVNWEKDLAAKSLGERIKLLYGNEESGSTEKILMYCLSEGPFTESYSNSLQNITLLGILSEMAQSAEIKGQNISKLSFALKSAGFFNNEYGNKASSVINEQLKSLGETVGMPGLADVGSNLVSILSGNKPIFPLLWWDSTFSCAYNFTVRLYNPNPANKELHMQTIVKPLCVLLACMLPAASGSSFSDNTYSSPLYFDVESPGIFKLNNAMITNMSVVKGGDDNAIAFNGRPSVVDVRFGVTPTYDKRVITANSDSNIDSRDDMNALSQDNGYKIPQRNTPGNNIIASTNQPVSDKEPTKRTPLTNFSIDKNGDIIEK